MEQILNYERPAANDDFFREPEPFKLSLVPVSDEFEIEELPTFLLRLA